MAITEDNVMRGLIDSRKRRKGWKTSADYPNQERASQAVNDFCEWMRKQASTTP